MPNPLRTACARAAFIAGSLCMYLRHPRLVLQFIGRLGYLPHVCDPRTKQEKLLWRKIFDRNPLFPVLGDRLSFCECTLFPIGGFSVISGGIDEQIAAAWDLRGTWLMTEPQPGLRGLYARLLSRHGHDARRAAAAGS